MHTILIVEDESSSSEMLAFVLKQEGYAVMIAENGREALSRLSEGEIDLVLCDLMMPVMDGRELCRAMQTDQELARLPIVIMSAAPEASVVHLTEEGCGYSSFMRKPLDLDLLTATLRNLLTTKD